MIKIWLMLLTLNWIDCLRVNVINETREANYEIEKELIEEIEEGDAGLYEVDISLNVVLGVFLSSLFYFFYLRLRKAINERFVLK